MTIFRETCYLCCGTGIQKLGLRDGDSVKCKTCGGTGSITLIDTRTKDDT